MQEIAQREIVVSKAALRCGAVLVFITLTVLSGFVRIPVPMSPVPVTLQTFFVLLAGASLGAWRGSLSQAGYLALGACGVPVFSTVGSGILYLLGPTGGYMAGFVFAAFFIGSVRRSCASSFSGLLAMFVIADAILLFSGALWLKMLTGCTIEHMMQIGVIPFVPGDLLKAAGAAVVYRAIRPRLEQIL